MRYVISIMLVVCWAMSAAWGAVPEGFYTSFAPAQAAAIKQNKPIYLHFTTTWCKWCRTIEQETYPKPEVKAALTDFVPASLDCTVPNGGQASKEAQTNLALFAKYGGDGYPYLVMLTPEGGKLNTVSGYVPAAVFIQALATAKANLQEYRSFMAFAATADRQSYDYQLRALRLYSKLGQDEPAAAAARRVLDLDPANTHGDGAQANYVLLTALSPDNYPGKAHAYLAQVEALDPKNEHGWLEKALQHHAQYYLQSAQQAETQDEQTKALTHCADTLTELTTRAAQLADGQRTYAMLGMIEQHLGNRARAIAALEKALALDPKSAIAQQIREQLTRLKNTPK